MLMDVTVDSKMLNRREKFEKNKMKYMRRNHDKKSHLLQEKERRS